MNINNLQVNIIDCNNPIVNKMKHMLIFQDAIRYIVFIDLIFSSKFKP
jgi:hypothetical protein